jgi:hypothetical protein
MEEDFIRKQNIRLLRQALELASNPEQRQVIERRLREQEGKRDPPADGDRPAGNERSTLN